MRTPVDPACRTAITSTSSPVASSARTLPTSVEIRSALPAGTRPRQWKVSLTARRPNDSALGTRRSTVGIALSGADTLDDDLGDEVGDADAGRTVGRIAARATTIAVRVPV